MRPIELTPVMHCLPAVKSPGTDHGDMANTHMLYKHRKVLTPNSNLKLQTITGVTVTKPKLGKRGHTVGVKVGGSSAVGWLMVR